MLRPFLLTTFALLAIISTGCLFSGRPCAPGNWRYHSYGCRHTSGPGKCQGCETPSPLENLDDTRGRLDRPMIQPTPEKIPPLPTTGRSRSLLQVAHLQGNGFYQPKIDAISEPVENAVTAGVQKCSWQQPDDMPSLSALEANTPEEPPRNNGVPASIPQPVPYAWGYFGASGRW